MFSSCVEEPAVGDAAAFIDRQIADQHFCGDGIVQSWEACERGEELPCDPLQYVNGIRYCEGDCNGWDIDECYSRSACRNDLCNNTGDCAIAYETYYCICDEGYTGNNCKACAAGYHHEGKTCKKNMTCDEIICNEHQQCIPYNYGDAYCECLVGYIGDICEECSSGYHREGNDCIKNIRCSADSCSEYELCHDDSGVPECDCNNEHHDPSDCSKCLPDYTMEEFECINQKNAPCRPNPAKPPNAKDNTSSHTITYTDADGWSAPPYCTWACDTGYVSQPADTCNKLIRWSTYTYSKLQKFIAAPEGIIYLGELSHLSAISAETGTPLWQVPVSGTIKSLFLLSDDTILWRGSIFSLQGELLQQSFSSSEGRGALGSDGSLYVDDWVYDGQRRQKPLVGLFGEQKIIVPGGDIVSLDGSQIQRRQPDGDIVWQITLSTTSTAYPLSVGMDGSIYFASNSWNIYRISKEGTSSIIANPNASVVTTLLVDKDDSVYGVTSSNILFKVRANGSFSIKHILSAASGCIFSNPVLTTDSILVAFSCQDNSIYSKLNFRAISFDGKTAWQYSMTIPTVYKTSDALLQESLLGPDGTWYVATPTVLYAVRPTPFGIPTTAPWPMAGHDTLQTGNAAYPFVNDPPSIPADPSPAPGTMNIDFPAELSWTASTDVEGDSIVYDVFLGTTTNDLVRIAEDIAEPKLSLPETIDRGIVYYWRVSAKDTDGSVIFSDTWHFSVKDENFLWSYDAGATVQAGIAQGDDGTIYFATGTPSLTALREDGTVAFTHPSTYTIPKGPVIGADGTVYFIDSSPAVTALSPDGSVLWQQPLSAAPTSEMAIDGDGDIYVCLSDKTISRIVADGSSQSSISAFACTDMVIGNGETLLLTKGVNTLTMVNTTDLTTRDIAVSGLSQVIPSETSLIYTRAGGTLSAHYGDWVSAPLPATSDLQTFLVSADRTLHAIHQYGSSVSLVNILPDNTFEKLLLPSEITSARAPMAISDQEMIFLFASRTYNTQNTVTAISSSGTVLRYFNTAIAATDLLISHTDGRLFIANGTSIDTFSTPYGTPPSDGWTMSRHDRRRTGRAGPATVNHAPTTPILVSPANDDLSVTDHTSFSWEAVADPDGDPVTYRVFIWQDNESPAPASDHITGTSFVPGTFPSTVTYYWRVAAYDSAGNVSLSETRSFLPLPETTALPGEIKWALPGVDKVIESPDGLFLVRRNGILTAIDQNRTLLYTLPENINSSSLNMMAGTQGWYIFLDYGGTSSKTLYAYAYDGSLRWQKDGIYKLFAIGPDDTVYVRTNNYAITALKNDGTLLWETAYNINNNYPAIRINKDGDLYLYFYSYKRVVGIDHEGSLSWTTSIDDGGGSCQSSSVTGIFSNGDLFAPCYYNGYRITPDGMVAWEAHYSWSNIFRVLIAGTDDLICHNYVQDSLIRIDGALDTNETISTTHPAYSLIGLAQNGDIVYATDSMLVIEGSDILEIPVSSSYGFIARDGSIVLLSGTSTANYTMTVIVDDNGGPATTGWPHPNGDSGLTNRAP